MLSTVATPALANQLTSQAVNPYSPLLVKRTLPHRVAVYIPASHTGIIDEFVQSLAESAGGATMSSGMGAWNSLIPGTQESKVIYEPVHILYASYSDQLADEVAECIDYISGVLLKLGEEAVAVERDGVMELISYG